MPRQPRLDALQTLHHVMVRGIERTALFRDDADRADCVARLTELVEQGALTVFAWARLTIHAHIPELVRSLHLNPVWAGVLPDLHALGAIP